MCNKLTANIILDEKLKTSPLRSEQDSGVHFATIIQHSFGNLTHGNHWEKEIKWIQIRKEVKLSLFVDDMIPHIENPKAATRRLLDVINEFGKISG